MKFIEDFSLYFLVIGEKRIIFAPLNRLHIIEKRPINLNCENKNHLGILAVIASPDRLGRQSIIYHHDKNK